MLIEVQTIRQNNGNWKYDVLGRKEFINPDHIKRIVPTENVFQVHLVGDDERYPTIVGPDGLEKLTNPPR